MDRQPTLTGATLRLRPLQADDWAALYGVASDPQIWAVHPAHDRWQEAVFRAFFDDAMAQGGALVVEDKGTGAVIGSTRYQFYPPDSQAIEIGWTFLARAYWGGATNRELKHLMLDHALRSLDRVVFVVGADNVRSRRAMEKIGGRLSADAPQREMAGNAMPHVVYQITRAMFASA